MFLPGNRGPQVGVRASGGSISCTEEKTNKGLTFQTQNKSVHTSAEFTIIICRLRFENQSRFTPSLPPPPSLLPGVGLKLPCMHLLVPVMHLCSFTDSAPSIITENPLLCSPRGLESLPEQSKSQRLSRTRTPRPPPRHFNTLHFSFHRGRKLPLSLLNSHGDFFFPQDRKRRVKGQRSPQAVSRSERTRVHAGKTRLKKVGCRQSCC